MTDNGSLLFNHSANVILNATISGSGNLTHFLGCWSTGGAQTKIGFAPPGDRDTINSMPAAGYRYLVNLPDVRGGNTIVDGTRIGAHDVVGLIVNRSS